MTVVSQLNTVLTMIEWLMVFALGFLTASLSVLAIIPIVHARATRLAARRVMLDLPISMTEVQADRDARRAEFAVATRRLEIRIAELTARLAKQMADLSRKSDYIRRLENDLTAKTTQLAALSVSNRGVREHLTEDASYEAQDRQEPSLPELLAKLSNLNPEFTASPLVPAQNAHSGKLRPNGAKFNAMEEGS